MTLDRIYAWARLDPQRRAVVQEGRVVTYGQFARGIESRRLALRALGLPAGSTTVIAVQDLFEGWMLGLALRSLGMDTVSVMTIKDAEALGIRNVSCIIADQAACRPKAPDPRVWPGARLIEPAPGLFRALPQGMLPEAPDPGLPRGGHILYTSGTTGTYKKLFLDGGREEARNVRRADCLGLTSDCVWLVAYLGAWTAVGFKMPLATWHTGGCVVFDQRTDWAAHAVEQGTTHTLLIPRMVSQLLAEVERQPAWPARGTWRLIVTGGFLPVSMARAVLERLTDNLAVTYGSTELCSPALDTRITSLEDMYWLAASDGRILEIVDDAGSPCPDGVEGHLRVRLLPLDCNAYLDDPETSARVFRDGCFYPGDMAVRRGDGRIRVLGRSADVLNFQGRKLAAVSIEQALQEKLGVSAVCLFSGLNQAGQDEIMVAVESERFFDQEDLRNLARQLVSFERVRIAILRKFPLTSTGTQKVNRPALRKLLFPAG